MALLKLLIFLLTFIVLIVDLDALICSKGQRVARDKPGCEICPEGFYQPEENPSYSCKVCSRCDENSGSAIEQKCTKETDTKCKCRGQFVRWDDDSSTCKCDIGFGLKEGECSKCEEGYFSSKINSRCQKWKDCRSVGVKFNGNNTSDVICNERLKSSTHISTPPTSNKTVSVTTTHHPLEGAQTQKMSAATTSPRLATSKEKHHPSHPPNAGNHIGMALLIFGIAGLLLLTAVTCKLHITTCWRRKTAVQTKDSLCRTPVEESGDSLTSLKQNPEEP